MPRSGAVTEGQRSQNRKATQPSGRRFFLAPTSLLTPYRPLKGMRVARDSSGPKIPRRKRGRIYEMGYLVEPALVLPLGNPNAPKMLPTRIGPFLARLAVHELLAVVAQELKLLAAFVGIKDD